MSSLRWRCTDICSRPVAQTKRFFPLTPVGHQSFANARSPGLSRAQQRLPVSTAAALEHFAELYAVSSPALVRCGWGLERNRNGGNAALAVLALPAVGGKFGVRAGGYTMSNSASWDIGRPWLGEEPRTRLLNMNHLGRDLLERDDPPIKMLFVYNANPVATVPDQQRILKGLEREDLFTVVFEQVMTDTAVIGRCGASGHHIPRIGTISRAAMVL